MSYLANKKKYIKVMFSFVKGDLGGPAFVRKFLKLWKADRDAQWAAEGDGMKTIDEPLQDAFANRQPPTPKGRQQSNLEIKFIDMLDKVFSACDAFNVDPKDDWELDEGQLRSFVAEMLESYFLVIL